MAQVTLPRQLVVDVNGEPRVGARMFIYDATTTTVRVAYTSKSYTIQHSQPILATEGGLFPMVEVDPAGGNYKIVIQDADGVQIYTEDNLVPTVDALTSHSVGMVLYPRTQAEISSSIVPNDYGFETGDVRRYVVGAVEQSRCWYCHGHTATYTSGTTFTVPGNVTSIYRPFVRLLVVGNSGASNNVRTISSTFALGITTVTVIADSGGALPSPIRSVSIQVLLDADGPTGSTYNADSFNGGIIFANRHNGTNAVARATVAALNSSGASNCAVVLVAVPSTYTVGGGAYLTQGFATPPYAVLYSQVGCPLDIGTSDTSRIGIPADGSAVVVKTDLTVNKGNGTADRTTLTLNGLVDARLAFSSNSAEKGFMFADATEVTLGSNASIPVSIVTGGTRRLTMPAGGLADFADDAAAAAGSVPVGSMYRTGSILKVRVA